MGSSRKIVLYYPQSACNPKPPNTRWSDELPLSVLTIAAWPLADGFEIVLVDGTRYTREEAHRRVVEACKDALLFGSTGMIGPQVRDGLECTRKVKAANPKLTTIVGGWFASVAPEMHLETGVYDAAAIGQGELTFREVVQAVYAGEPLDNIQGLALWRDGQMVKTPPRAVVGWDALLNCPWHLLDVEDYRPPGYKPGRPRQRVNGYGPITPQFQVSYYSSFGCPIQCTFCCSPQVSGLRWKAMPADRMLDDLCEFQDRWGWDGVQFYDANFGVDIKRLTAFCEGVLERNRKFGWISYMQAETVIRSPKSTVDAIAESGMYNCILGAEAGSEDTMKRVRKNTRVDGNRIAAIELDKRGVQPRMTYIIGYPNETDESMLATIDEARRISIECPNARPEVWHFRPIPGTVDFGEAVKCGYKPPKDLDGWGYIGDYWNDEPWPGRVSPEVERTRRLFMHYSSLAQGLVRQRIGWWERRAKTHLESNRFGQRNFEARAFSVYDRVTRKFRKNGKPAPVFEHGVAIKEGSVRERRPAPVQQ